MNPVEINVLILAYLGDTIYEYYIRKYLIEQKIATVDALQKKSIDYVSAKSQAKYLAELQEKNFFTDEENDVLRRARNHKGTGHPKNTDILTYKHATSLEALIGFLELQGKRNRIEEIINEILEESTC